MKTADNTTCAILLGSFLFRDKVKGIIGNAK
jgi:hypothetical protein